MADGAPPAHRAGLLDRPVDDPAAVERLLADRARALAVPLRAEVGEAVDLVVLAVEPERYGVDATRVVEVQPLAGLTPVPGLPALWAGVVNVRGTLWPVLDLRRYLSLPDAAGRRGPAKVAFVAAAGLTVGLLVDDALEIRRVPAAQVGPPPAGGSVGDRAPVRGTTADLVTVLDVDRLAADPSLVVREESA